jgi:hypothetical protein
MYIYLCKHHHHKGNEGSISQMLFGDQQLNSKDAEDPVERDHNTPIRKAVPMLVKVVNSYSIYI